MKAIPPPPPIRLSSSSLSLVWAVGGAGQGHWEGAGFRAKASSGHEWGMGGAEAGWEQGQKRTSPLSQSVPKRFHGQRSSAPWHGFHYWLCNDHPKFATEGWGSGVRPPLGPQPGLMPSAVCCLGSSCKMPGSLLETLEGGREGSIASATGLPV